MTQEKLQRFRKVLEARQADTAERLTQSRRRISAEKCADALEETSHNGERELAFASLSRDSELMRDIGAALHRIEDGTFGICRACGEEIGSKRLAAVPWTPLCIRCREAVDREDPGTLELFCEVRANAA